MKTQQRMVFMVQEEYMYIACIHPDILCVYLNGLRKGLSLQSTTSMLSTSAEANK